METGGHVTKTKRPLGKAFESNEKEIMSDFAVDFKYGYSYFKLLDPANFLQIKPYQSELEKSRADDMKTVMRSINEVRSDLEALKSEVWRVTEIQNADFLRKNMFSMEERISNLKDAVKEEFLKLLRNEVSLSRDVHLLERRIEEWGKPVDFQTLKPVKQSSYRIKTNADNPIIQFQKFLSCSGGHYGGWEEQDHLLFLKERSKYKKKEKFVLALHSLLPDLSFEQIEEHEKWYQKYESLKESQKEAIQKWRLEKETQQKKEKENKEDREEKKKVTKKVQQQINIAERIREWKNQQQLKKLEEEERQKKEKEKLKHEEKRKQELQEMRKLAVAQYKAEKLNRISEVFARHEKHLPTQEEKSRNKILLKTFRLQDLKFIEKKKVIRLQIESKSSDKLRLAKPALELILRRDPQRVFQPTIIWNQHCQEGQKREKVNPVFDLNSIPRLHRQPLECEGHTGFVCVCFSKVNEMSERRRWPTDELYMALKQIPMSSCNCSF